LAIAALQAARAKITADTALIAYFNARYGKPAKHILGYKRPINANDFPQICYTPALSTRANSVGGRNEERVSIVVGIHEPGVTDDAFDGVIQLAIIEDLIFNCLESGELGGNAIYLGEPKVINDLTARHPFHELEISCLLAAR